MAVLYALRRAPGLRPRALLDGAALSLEAGERLGLIGRNGAGKSSLLKILAGLEKLDDGLLQIDPGPAHPLRAAGAGVRRRRTASSKPSAKASPRRARCASATRSTTTATTSTRADADRGARRLELGAARRDHAATSCTWTARASRRALGRQKKRVALAQALVAEPDVLLLDEPTNHLDLDAIEWLEELLRDFTRRVVWSPHDRAFLDAVATRIVELDRGAAAQLSRQLHRVRAHEGRAARVRGAGQRARRQAAGAGGGLDPQGRGGAAHAQRRPRRAARGAARRSARSGASGSDRCDWRSTPGAPSGKLVAELEDVIDALRRRRAQVDHRRFHARRSCAATRSG